MAWLMSDITDKSAGHIFLHGKSKPVKGKQDWEECQLRSSLMDSWDKTTAGPEH